MGRKQRRNQTYRKLFLFDHICVQMGARASLGKGFVEKNHLKKEYPLIASIGSSKKGCYSNFLIISRTSSECLCYGSILHCKGFVVQIFRILVDGMQKKSFEKGVHFYLPQPIGQFTEVVAVKHHFGTVGVKKSHLRISICLSILSHHVRLSLTLSV